MLDVACWMGYMHMSLSTTVCLLFKNARVRCANLKATTRSITYLLVHHVVEKHVFVIRVLVLLGEHWFTVHELLAWADVRALGAIGTRPLARPFAHGLKYAARPVQEVPFSRESHTVQHKAQTGEKH